MLINRDMTNKPRHDEELKEQASDDANLNIKW